MYNKKMRSDQKKKILFCINTPAQVHTWRYVIEYLIREGHEVEILAREYGSTIELLSDFRFHFHSFKPLAKNWLRLFEIFVHIQNGLKVHQGFNPSLIVGFGIDAAAIATLLRKPSVIFIDNDPTYFQNKMTAMFAKAIITPECFRTNLGKNHILIKGYKELAYLHPNYFNPDPKIFDELAIKRNEKYIIVRFNAFDAVHDIGKRGFSLSNQLSLVKILEKYARVFVAPEGKLDPDLNNYRLPINKNRIHHALYYSQLFVSDTGTMNAEAAILGTPGIFYLPTTMLFGNFIELETKYDLMYMIKDQDLVIKKAIDLIQQKDLKEKWAIKRQRLLADKTDVARFMTNIIENYPDSLSKYQTNRARK